MVISDDDILMVVPLCVDADRSSLWISCCSSPLAVVSFTDFPAVSFRHMSTGNDDAIGAGVQTRPCIISLSLCVRIRTGLDFFS